MQFPSGVLADRFGERRIIAIAVGGTALGSFLLAISPAFPVFLLCVVLLGAVAGLHYTPGTSLISRVYEDVGGPVGVHNVGAPLAGLVAPMAAAWVGSRYGWRPAVGLALAVALPVFLLVVWRIRPVEPTNPGLSVRGQFKLGPIRELLTRPGIAFTVAIATAGTFVWQGTASFLPTFLISHRGHSPTLAGIVFSAYFVVQGFGQVGIGVLSDRYGRDFTIAGCMIVGAAGFFLFVFGPGLASVAAAILLAGVGMSYHSAVLSRFLDELSEAEQGTGFGLVRTVYGILGASGSIVVGLFADLFDWTVSFALLAALLVVVFAALLVNRAFGLGY
jgi:MFS family permease